VLDFKTGWGGYNVSPSTTGGVLEFLVPLFFLQLNKAINKHNNTKYFFIKLCLKTYFRIFLLA